MSREETCALTRLRPFLLVAKIFGIFGCSIYGERVKKSGFFSHCYCTLWIAITYYMTPINVLHLFDKEVQILGLQNAAFFLTIAGDMYNSIFQQRRIVAVFEKIHRYDSRVSNLGFSRRDVTIIYSLMGSIPLAMWFGEKLMSIFVDDYEILPFFSRLKFWYYPAMSYFVVMKFCMFVHIIYQRFKYLNEHVAKRVVDGNGLYNRQSVTIYEIRYLHSTLCEAAGVLMEIYSPWILLWCGVMAIRISKAMGNFIRHGVFDASIFLTVIWMISLGVSCGVASDEVIDIELNFDQKLNKVHMYEAMLNCTKRLQFQADKIAQRLIENRPLSGGAADTTVFFLATILIPAKLV